MRPYLYERQTEYWSARGIETYFSDAGFEVLTFPITQVTERRLPVDFIFLDATHAKLFALQFKTLHGNGRDGWPINLRQRRDLLTISDWAYYGLSQLSDGRAHRAAVHKLAIVPIENVPNEDFLVAGALGGGGVRYFRWGGFALMLESCRAGRRVEDEEDLLDALTAGIEGGLPREITDMAMDVFIVAFETRRAIHLRSVVQHEAQD